MMLPFRLLVIADRGVCTSDDEFLARVERAGVAPGLWLQLRIKMLPLADRALLLTAAADMVGEARARTIVNGTLDEARDLGCAGAHYPEITLPPELEDHAGLLVGASVHSVAARQAAEEAGVDYVIAGSVFAPSSKPGDGRGLAWLAAMTRGSTVPVIAIGGITPHNVRDCLAAGAYGVAVLGGIFFADDPAVAAAAYRAPLH
jgi:thiamine-phosphate diphosphorylase